MLSIRPYAPSDLDDLIALFRNSIRIVARRDYTLEQVMAWAPDHIDRERRAVQFSSKRTWVAERDGIPVGFIILEPDGHVDMLYVHHDYQHQGVATSLLEHLEAEARRWGLSRLYTEASITARPFFERWGFRVISPQTVSVRGQEFVNFRMEKILAGGAVGDSPESPAGGLANDYQVLL